MVSTCTTTKIITILITISIDLRLRDGFSGYTCI